MLNFRVITLLLLLIKQRSFQDRMVTRRIIIWIRASHDHRGCHTYVSIMYRRLTPDYIITQQPYYIERLCDSSHPLEIVKKTCHSRSSCTSSSLLSSKVGPDLLFSLNASSLFLTLIKRYFNGISVHTQLNTKCEIGMQILGMGQPLGGQ